jgi:hypothetical protein
VVRRSPSRVGVALLLAALVSLCQAQPPAATTENQARYYVYGAFLTHAVPEIMGEQVALGPELAQRLGLAPGADRKRIYDALMSYTDGKRLAVRRATGAELARYPARRDLKSPVFTVQAGDILLLVEYDLKENTIPFVGQLAVAPPVVEQRSAPPVAAIAPKPAGKPAAKPRAAPPPVEVLKPNGPCVVTPVMSEQDLANCRAVPITASARVAPPPPPAAKPQAAVRPTVVPPPVPVRAGPCEVKPVMTEEELANCRAAPVARIQPGPPIVAKPQARVEPAPQPRRAAPCEVKPVMSEEELANCRNAPGGSARIDPGPPAVAKPQARVAPAPQPRRTAPCEVKPVMTEEELANCREAPGGAARVEPGPPVVARPVAAPEPARKPAAATPCVVKPVMSEEDLIACGIRR